VKPVNLLPEDARPRRAAGSLPGSAYVVVGVLVALLAMVSLYVLTSNQVSSREADAAKAKQETAQAKSQIAQLGPFADFTQVTQTRVTSVKALAQARFDWERFVRELALVLPDGTWLNAVDAATTGDTSGAGAPAAAGSTAPTGPSANLQGCALHQPDVAKLMVRLRKMNRVNDVQLAESSQKVDGSSASQSSTSSAPGVDCGSRYHFNVTVTFDEANASAPTGTVHKVPASLGGGE
jgi:Tfp pilus assembly protein PilN